MRIIVTGGAGFIGSNLCRHLVRDVGASVLNIDALTYAASPASLDDLADDDRYTFLKADICDRSAMSGAFSSFGPDAVMHLAAESHVDRSIDASDAFVRTNVLGTHALLEAARAHWSDLPDGKRDAFRFLHVSTDEVYGSLGEDGHFVETTPYDPSSPYSASKAASDHLAIAWHRTYGLPVLLSNCSNNYGPFQFPEKLIPLMILNARKGKQLPVYGDGMNVRDWIHVDDHVRGLVRVLEAGRVGETYNLGGRAERTNLAVVNAICAAMDRYAPDRAPHHRLIAFVPDRPGHDRRYAIDCAKAESELGWRPQQSFESALDSTVAWYLDNKDWWEPLREKRYDGGRLGLSGTA